MRLYHRSQKRVCAKKEKDISIVQNREREGSEVLKESVEEEIYLTTKVTTNITDALCAKEGWKEEEGTRLQEEEGVYRDESKYNNMRIKEKDEQKAVFLILKSAYKPIVMFFRLTN